MKIKNIFENLNSKASFFAGVLVSLTVLLLLNATIGISDEKMRSWGGKHDYNRGDDNSDFPKGDVQNLRLVVKYISGGDIIVLDEKGEVIARSSNEHINQGPLVELRNISFITVTQNPYEPEEKDPKLGLIDFIIPPAIAAMTTRYEYHYIKIDNQIIACRKHKVTTKPSSHTDVGKCPNS